MNRLVKYLTIIVLLSSALNVSAQSDERVIRKGNRAYRSADYEQAIAYYREALQIRPNNARAQFNLGDAYYAKQSYDTAFVEFEDGAAAAEEVACVVELHLNIIVEV